MKEFMTPNSFFSRAKIPNIEKMHIFTKDSSAIDNNKTCFNSQKKLIYRLMIISKYFKKTDLIK